MLDHHNLPGMHQDPECIFGHTECLDRDGKPVANGKACWATARTQAMQHHPSAPQQPREKPVNCRVCQRSTWSPSALCCPDCYALYNFYASVDVSPGPTLVLCKRDGCGELTTSEDGYCGHVCKVIAGREHIDWDYDRHGFGSMA